MLQTKEQGKNLQDQANKTKTKNNKIHKQSQTNKLHLNKKKNSKEKRKKNNKQK